MSTACEMRHRYLRGCNFEAVYDERLPEGSSFGNLEGSAIGCIEFVKAHKSRVYVGHVCTRCGAQTKREAPDAV